MPSGPVRSGDATVTEMRQREMTTVGPSRPDYPGPPGPDPHNPHRPHARVPTTCPSCSSHQDVIDGNVNCAQPWSSARGSPMRGVTAGTH